MFGVTLVSSGVALGLVPWSSGLAGMLVAFIFNGFGVGFLMSGIYSKCALSYHEQVS
jgi:hypothetical protein